MYSIGRDKKSTTVMAKKKFKIRAKLVFSGEVTVQAQSRQEAEALVQRHVSARLGTVFVHPMGDEEVIQDYDFAVKGEAVINRKQEADDGQL